MVHALHINPKTGEWETEFEFLKDDEDEIFVKLGKKQRKFLQHWKDNTHTYYPDSMDKVGSILFANRYSLDDRDWLTHFFNLPSTKIVPMKPSMDQQITNLVTRSKFLNNKAKELVGIPKSRFGIK